MIEETNSLYIKYRDAIESEELKRVLDAKDEQLGKFLYLFRNFELWGHW